MGACPWDHHPLWEFHQALAYRSDHQPLSAYRSVSATPSDHQSVLVFLWGCQLVLAFLSVLACLSDHRPWWVCR